MLKVNDVIDVNESSQFSGITPILKIFQVSKYRTCEQCSPLLAFGKTWSLGGKVISHK